MRRVLRRLLWPSVILVGVLAALSLSLFPARTWLDQQRAIAASEVELAELDAEVAELQARIAALDSPEEIELLARERFNMVRPGEEAYSILPMPAVPLEIPPGWPFTAAPPSSE